jgi:predicted phosphohydrolase
MKFQYISDIHLECGNNHLEIIPKAPYLILAGDIGYPFEIHYNNFLQDVTDKFEKVFVILGNHEYWGNSFANISAKMSEYCQKYKNLVWLESTVYDFENSNLSIFGTTLWTNISNPDLIREHVYDYKHIPSFTPETCTNLHKCARLAFLKQLQERPDRKWIAICHHVPHTSLIDKKYEGNPLNEAYASDVDEFRSDNVLAVVYGHTHVQRVTEKYYCNPYGYPGENSITNRDLHQVFDIQM